MSDHYEYEFDAAYGVGGIFPDQLKRRMRNIVRAFASVEYLSDEELSRMLRLCAELENEAQRAVLQAWNTAERRSRSQEDIDADEDESW